MVIIKVLFSKCQLKVILVKMTPEYQLFRAEWFFPRDIYNNDKTNVQTLANKCFMYCEITVSHFQIYAVLATVLFFLFCNGGEYLTVAGQQ